MSALVPFDSAKLPAHIKAKKVANPFASLVRSGFKVLSTKSKSFAIVDGAKRQPVMSPSDPDVPAPSIEVVIMATNPNKSRVYYKTGYEEGNSAKPDCYTNDGTAPAADAANPQSKKCAACKQAQYGSKINDSGKKSFACVESLRLCVAPAGQLNDLMLLRVPQGSLKLLGRFGETLSLRGSEPHQVVTKIWFDHSHESGKSPLSFKAVSFVSEEMAADVEGLRTSETVGYITGVAAMPVSEPDAEDEDFVPPPKAEAKVAAKTAPADEDDLPTTPRNKVNVEAAEPPAEKPAKKPATVTQDDDGLNDLDFDD